MDEKELMAAAKRRFPEGCTIKCANDNIIDKGEDDLIDYSKWAYMTDFGIHQGNAWIHLKGKWATIIDTVKPFTIGGYVRAIVDGNTDKSEHNCFKKGDIIQIKSIHNTGLINYDQPGPRLYTRSGESSYPKECEWIGMNPHETLPQDESLVEVINNFPIY